MYIYYVLCIVFCSLHLCRYRSFSRDSVLKGSSYSHRRCANNDLWILIGTAAVRIVVGGFLIRTAVKIVSCCLLFAEPLCFVIFYWLLLFIQFIRGCEVSYRTSIAINLQTIWPAEALLRDTQGESSSCRSAQWRASGTD